MAIYLTILEGSRPGDAEPILAIKDKRIIQLVMDELHKRFQGSHYPQVATSTTDKAKARP